MDEEFSVDSNPVLCTLYSVFLRQYQLRFFSEMGVRSHPSCGDPEVEDASVLTPNAPYGPFPTLGLAQKMLPRRGSAKLLVSPKRSCGYVLVP